MTKLFSLFIILSFVLPVSGQEKLDSDKARKEKAYHLTGSVREQGERPYPDPLPDVNIQLYSLPDTSFIEGTVSDKKGVFRLYPMNPGNYLIRASFLGYETIEKKGEYSCLSERSLWRCSDDETFPVLYWMKRL